MHPPPDPEMRRAALAGSPKSHGDDLKRHQSSEVAPALQEKRFRRVYSFCQRTASAIAHSVNETAETEQTRKIEASLRERAEARA
jgi:hypothetical protein